MLGKIDEQVIAKIVATATEMVLRATQEAPAYKAVERVKMVEVNDFNHVYELNSISFAHAVRNAGNFFNEELAKEAGLKEGNGVSHSLGKKSRASTWRILDYMVGEKDRIPILEPNIPGVPLYCIQNKPGTENDPRVYQLCAVVTFPRIVCALAKKHNLGDKKLQDMAGIPNIHVRGLRPDYSPTAYSERLEKALLEIDRADPHPTVGKYPSDYFYTITRIDPPDSV